MSQADAASSPGLGEIASGLVGDMQDLVRGELALARAELDKKSRAMLARLISLVGSALLAFAGLVVLLEGIAAVLARWMPTWGALLIVGAAILLIGGLIARTALSRLSLKALTPERTIENVERDARMIKEHA